MKKNYSTFCTIVFDFPKRYEMIRYIHCICKTQINVQALIGHSILKSMSEFYVINICTSNLCPFFKFSYRSPILKSMSFFKFSNQHPILKYVTVSHFLESTLNDATDECLNPYPNQKISHRSENLERMPI